MEFGDDLFACNYMEDTAQLDCEEEDIRQPTSLDGLLSSLEESRLAEIDFSRESDNLGCDLYLDAINCLS